MSTIGVLVCDSTSARIYALRDGESVPRLQSVIFTGAARRGSWLRLVRSGPLSDARAALEAKEDGEHRLARTASKSLDEAARSQNFREWILIAPQSVVECVLHEVPASIRDGLRAAQANDATPLDEALLARRVRDILRSASRSSRSVKSARR